MIKRLQLFIAATFLSAAALFTGVMATTQPVSAACSSSFLTFPTWYRGLIDSNCDLVAPGEPADDGRDLSLQNYIWVIVLNVIEIVLQLIAYLTVFMIIYGGFRFMTSAGEPTQAANARKTIITAMIGLGVSSVSIGVVNLIFSLIEP